MMSDCFAVCGDVVTDRVAQYKALNYTGNKRNHRSNGFTTRHFPGGLMYQDSTLAGATRSIEQQAKKEERLEQHKKKREQWRAQREEMERLKLERSAARHVPLQ